MRLLLPLALLGAFTAAQAQVSVHGYVRQDGTYVQPYQRTAPDSSLYNNYSTRGNINPYTGQPGTVSPYTAPVWQHQPHIQAPQTYGFQPMPIYRPQPILIQ